VTALTRGLARRGHQVTVCSTDACDRGSRLEPPKGSSPLRPWAFQDCPNVVVRVFPNLSNGVAYHLQGFLPFGLDAYLAQHARDFDVAHVHACRNVPGLLAARRLTRAAVPYVMAPNGTAPRIERRQFVKRLFDVVGGRRTMHGASRFVAVSDAERRDLVDLSIDPALIRVVPNSIDLDEFDAPIARGVFRQRFHLGDAPLVLFLGKITPRKRLDVVVRAFAAAHAPAARLVIAGNDMGSGAAARALVQALRLEHRTVFTGLLTGRERLEALTDADVVVYPTQQEIFGLVPLEALLCGTPVIVGDDSGCAEIVRATGGGRLVPIGDATALANDIDEIIAHAAPWRDAADAAAGIARSMYGADAVCARLEQVYAEMVA